MLKICKIFNWLLDYEDVNPKIVYEKDIKVVPILGTTYKLTVRTLEEIIKYSDSVDDNSIHIAGGIYDVEIISKLILKQTVRVAMHETGSCLVFADKDLPEIANGFAATFLFKEQLID